MNVFRDQAAFMAACGQTLGQRNPDQFNLYVKLIHEEVGELSEAIESNDRAEIFDALMDIIVVCVGAGLSDGLPMEEGWKEVIRSNMSKVDPDTGKVTRRADGKILKPHNWVAPQLALLL